MIKDIILDFKEAHVWLAKWLFYRRHAVKMRLAISLADIKQKAFNRRYHVMLMELPTGTKLVSVNNSDIEKFKRKKWLPKNMGMIELRDAIFYSTPLSSNNSSAPEQRKAARDKYIRYARKFPASV